MATYIAFDTRSGRILSVHHGASDATEAWGGAQDYTRYQGQHDAVISDEHVAVIAVPPDAVEEGKQYKVDVSRRTLVATENKDGVSFGFGLNAQSSAPAPTAT